MWEKMKKPKKFILELPPKILLPWSVEAVT